MMTQPHLNGKRGTEQRNNISTLKGQGIRAHSKTRISLYTSDRDSQTEAETETEIDQGVFTFS